MNLAVEWDVKNNKTQVLNVDHGLHMLYSKMSEYSQELWWSKNTS